MVQLPGKGRVKFLLIPARNSVIASKSQVSRSQVNFVRLKIAIKNIDFTEQLHQVKLILNFTRRTNPLPNLFFYQVGLTLISNHYGNKTLIRGLKQYRHLIKTPLATVITSVCHYQFHQINLRTENTICFSSFFHACRIVFTTSRNDKSR